MKATTPSIIDRAIALAPELRERSDEAARLRRLPDATWSALLDSRMLRGLQPSRWGGLEADPGEHFAAVSEVSRADGSAGWVTDVIGVHPWQLALFPKETQEEVWGHDPCGEPCLPVSDGNRIG